MLDLIRHLFITGEDDDGQIDDYQYGEQDRLQTVSFEMVKICANPVSQQVVAGVCAGWGSTIGWRNRHRRVPTTIFKL